MVVTLNLLQGQIGKACVEIALDRPQIDAKLIGKGLWVKLLTLIELNQNLREAVNQGVVIVRGHKHKRSNV